jgi:Tol biopolymer transport system component
MRLNHLGIRATAARLVAITALAGLLPAGSALAAASGDLVLVSVTEDGTGANASSANGLSVSDNGRYIAFATMASNLDPRDSDREVDIYVKDLITGDLKLASVAKDGTKANSLSMRPVISGDGTQVAFPSAADNLSPDDTDGYFDLYVKNLVTGDLTLASVNGDGTKADGNVTGTDISGDGTVVAFSSTATNLPDAPGDNESHVYVKNLDSGAVVRVDGGTLQRPDEQSGGSEPSISTDGGIVAFATDADGLDERDTDRHSDVYVRNLGDGSIQLASDSAAGVKADASSGHPSLSGDGSRVAFQTSAGNLIADDTDGESDVYVKDLDEESTILASVGSDGANSDRSAGYPALSSDGAHVAFSSDATNLGIATDALVNQVYRKDLATGALQPASVTDDGIAADYLAIDPATSADGGVVAFTSQATKLVATDNKTWADVFAKLFETATPSDEVAPTGSVEASPTTLLASPHVATVDLSGVARDDGGISSVTIEIRDEYGESPPVVAAVDGGGQQAVTWSRTVALDRTLRPHDRERNYTAVATISDMSGNTSTVSTPVTVLAKAAAPRSG